MVEFFFCRKLYNFVPIKNFGFPILSPVTYFTPKTILFWHTINWDASPINRDYGWHYQFVNDKKDHHKHDMHKDQVQKPTLYSKFR